MCDYSLNVIPNRLAVEGEPLVVHRFPTGSIGLASAPDLCCEPVSQPKSFWQRLALLFGTTRGSPMIPAVCVPPGAHLILRAIPAYLQQRYGLEEEEGAILVQTNAVHTYRDALRFNNGAEVRLQDLRVGQPVEVLSLAGINPALYEYELQMQ